MTQLTKSIKPADKSPIVRLDSPGTTLYQVKSGSAFLMLDKFIVDMMFSGDYIGAEAFLSGGTYQYKVVAHRDCQLVYLPFTQIERTDELIRELTLQVAVRADRYAHRLKSMATEDIETQIRKCLRMLSASTIADENGKFYFTQENIANYCGCTRRTVVRVLQRLASNGDFCSQGFMKRYREAA